MKKRSRVKNTNEKCISIRLFFSSVEFVADFFIERKKREKHEGKKNIFLHGCAVWKEMSREKISIF
jgi:hypothetical protein